MLGKKAIRKKRAAGPAKFGMGLFMVVVAALFVMSFANSAGAFTLSGKVAEVDNAAQILTLNPAGTDDQIVFNVGAGAGVSMCDMEASLSSIKAGDEVTVRYYETSDGHWIAEEIMTLRC